MAKEISKDELESWLQGSRRPPGPITAIIGAIVYIWVLFLTLGTGVVWTIWIWGRLFG